MSQYSLQDLGLFSGQDKDKVFEIVVDLVNTMLRPNVALVSVIDEGSDHQFFKAGRGMSDYALKAGKPLSSPSLCYDVVSANGPLVIRDLASDGKYRDHVALSECGLRAYMGVPIYDVVGAPIGAVCAIDMNPRIWSDRDLEFLENLASLCSHQVLFRATLQTIKIIA